MKIFVTNVFGGLVLLCILSCGRIESIFSSEQDSKLDYPPRPVYSLAEQDRISKIKPGDRSQLVRDALGEPSGKIALGDKLTYFYNGLELNFLNDRLQTVPDDLVKAIEEGYEARVALIDAKAAREKEKRKRAAAAAKEARKSWGGEPNVHIRQNGQWVALANYVGKGTITIVEFYADWCGACKKIDPQLKKIAEDKHVNLVQIQVINQNSPVVQQYKLGGVPDLRVFDRNGQLLGRCGSSVHIAKKLIKQAKASG